MSEEPDRKFEVKKKVDSDWKRKVQMEKEKLSAASPTRPESPKAPAGKGEPPKEEKPKAKGMDMGFVALVQQLSDQAALFLGLVPGYPERHCDQALAAIEMLKALEGKTRGNLSDEESKALTGVLYELQMRYVQTCGGGAA